MIFVHCVQDGYSFIVYYFHQLEGIVIYARKK